MVRSILYQKPFNSKFYRDAFIFIGVLGVIGKGGGWGGGTDELGVRVLMWLAFLICIVLTLHLFLCTAAGGFLFSFIFYSVTTFIKDGRTLPLLVWGPMNYALRGFDLITIVVPPALPIAISIGTVYAVARLKKNNIFCIAQQRSVYVWLSHFFQYVFYSQGEPVW